MLKCFKTSTVDLTGENRRVFLTTPCLGEFISSVILFEETLLQKTDSGAPLVKAATTLV
jgi:fructose-bisphosphate aldolase class I